MSREEVIERFPEVKEIDDKVLAQEVVSVLDEHLPEYFWKVPASSTGQYHPEDHNDQHGLWIHTKRAFTAFERLSKSYKHQGKITEWERDCGRAAILLHDMFKYGKPPETKEHTVDDHDFLAARFLDKNTDLPPKVVGCVESHNGPEGWGKGKAPGNSLEQIHHLADMIASDRNGFFKIKEPVQEVEELLQHPEHER